AEAATWSPSLRVALRLARVLGTTVDQLFAAEHEPRSVLALPLGPYSLPGRARMALVWEKWVALPLSGDRTMRAGFSAASGRLVGPGDAQVWGSGRTIVVAGCDPALPLLAEPIAAAREGWTMEWWSCSSREALRLLDAGLVHAAAVHRAIAAKDRRPAPRNRARIGFAGWREGVLLADPGASPGHSLEEVLGRRLRWVNREIGSEARSLLDRELDRLGVESSSLVGYASQARGHLQVASAVASGVAQAGIATEPAALAFGLRFLALADEECVLEVERDRLDTPELHLLLAALGGPSLSRELATIPGYQVAVLGQEM
ncbi:MAG: substrate-binding domain-containing protein, partial [Candidatus Dormiibacterota bacterium]